MKNFRLEQLKGNYGNLCQRECDMKVTCQDSTIQVREITIDR